MEKRLLAQGKLLALTICCLSFICQPASAQAPDSTSILNKILYSINALVWTAANYIFQAPPNVGTEVVNNYAQTSASQTVPPNVKTLNDQDITNGLAPDTSNPAANLIQLATILASDTIVPGLTMGGVPVPLFAKGSETSKNALIQGNENFNFQSLINPKVYQTPDQQNKALNYIRFVSNFATPISNINLSSYPESQLSTQQKITIQNSGAYQAFAVQRRQLIAQQSALLTNLYWIYSKRLPVQSLNPSDVAAGTISTQNPITNLPTDNATKHPSAQQIAEFTANWRIANQTLAPQWYTQMSIASPTNVQREQLFIMAEIESLLFRLHQDNERIIALLTLNQLATLQTAKTGLQISEKRITDIIEGQIKSSAQIGTTSPAVVQPLQGTAQQQAQAARLRGAKQNIQQQERQAAQQQATIRAR